MDDLTELALSARHGNRLALGAFIRQTQADVWRTCAHLGPPQSADDLTQDTFLKAIRALPTFAGTSSARTWIIGIARHTAIDAVRARQRRQRRDQLLGLQRSRTDRGASTVELDALIGALGTGQKEAFVLTQILGLSYTEAAEAVGCSVGTIRSRVARARSELITVIERAETETHYG